MKHLGRYGATTVLLAWLSPVSIFAATISGTVTTDTIVFGMETPTKPVVNAKVILLNGTGAGAKQDSAITSVNGTYTLPNTGANGTKTIIINQPGYDPLAEYVAYSSANVTVNLVLFVNSNTSTIKGHLVTSSVFPIQDASVSLAGPVWSDPVSIKADSLGRFEIDSVPTGPGYTLFITANGYLNDTVRNINAPWDSIVSIGDIQLSQCPVTGCPAALFFQTLDQALLPLYLSSSQLSFTLPNFFSNSNSSVTIYTVSGDKLLESPISSKSNFSMPIGNLGRGKYFLEVKDSKNRIVQPFEVGR